MKALLVSFLAIASMASVVSASVMTSPFPLGPGKWALSINGVQDQNALNQTDGTLMQYQLTVGYGLTDRLDVYLGGGSSTSSGLQTLLPTIPPSAVPLDISGTGVSVATKYLIALEGERMPVSIGFAAQYTSRNIEMKAGGTPLPSQTKNEIAGGFGIAKAAYIPFIPYLALVYRSNETDGTQSSTQIDLSLGSMIAFSRQAALFVEYTSQAIVDKTGGSGNHTSAQLGASIGYTI